MIIAKLCIQFQMTNEGATSEVIEFKRKLMRMHQSDAGCELMLEVLKSGIVGSDQMLDALQRFGAMDVKRKK